MRAWQALIVTAVVTGCSGAPQSTADDVGATQPILFQTGRNSWLVVDKADKGKIVVQRDAMSTTARKARTALAQGDFEQAASAYLKNSGRRCRVGQGFLVVEHTWEFPYSCEERIPLVTGTVPKK